MTLIHQTPRPFIKYEDYHLLFKHKNNPVKNKRSFNVICDILSVPNGNIKPDWDNNTKDFYVRII